MEQRLADPTIRILVDDIHKRHTLSSTAEAVTWHPLERLMGCVVIQSTIPLILDEVTIQFKGISLYHFHLSNSGMNADNTSRIFKGMDKSFERGRRGDRFQKGTRSKQATYINLGR